MPTPVLALAVLATPLPEPTPCAVPTAVAKWTANVLAQGAQPGQPAITDLGGPFHRHQMELQARLSDRFGDLSAPSQVDRQLGRR